MNVQVVDIMRANMELVLERDSKLTDLDTRAGLIIVFRVFEPSGCDEI